MTDDENPWYSDSNSGATPPTVPDGSGFPTNPPAPRPPTGPQPAHNPPPGYGPQQYPQQAPAGYQSYGQPGYGQQGFIPLAQTNSKATTSMVIGIVGLASIFFCYGVLGIVLGPLSYFMGRSAQKEMAAAPNAWSNHGMAKAGWIMGLIQTIIAILAIIAVAAFFIWLSTADDSNF